MSYTLTEAALRAEATQALEESRRLLLLRSIACLQGVGGFTPEQQGRLLEFLRKWKGQ